MERELVMTGIGGQGVQLAGTIIAKGAAKEGKFVSMLGVYGGEMRGGPTGSTIIVSEERVMAPPKVSSAWSLLAFHPKYWSMISGQVRSDSLVVYNTDLAGAEHDGATYRSIPVPATSIATELGNDGLAAMVLVGAYLRIAGLVGVDAVKAAMAEAIPTYRRDRIAANDRALDAGFEAGIAS